MQTLFTITSILEQKKKAGKKCVKFVPAQVTPVIAAQLN